MHCCDSPTAGQKYSMHGRASSPDALHCTSLDARMQQATVSAVRDTSVTAHASAEFPLRAAVA